jgi:hypothetical protein
MKLKWGVRVHGVRPEILIAILVADTGWKHLTRNEVTVTEISGGTHSDTSDHYWGGAVDFRTNNLSRAKKEMVKLWMTRQLGPDYLVLLEEDPEPHMHVSWRPRKLS